MLKNASAASLLKDDLLYQGPCITYAIHNEFAPSATANISEENGWRGYLSNGARELHACLYSRFLIREFRRLENKQDFLMDYSEQGMV
jgi:hypothetical protein